MSPGYRRALYSDFWPTDVDHVTVPSEYLSGHCCRSLGGRRYSEYPGNTSLFRIETPIPDWSAIRSRLHRRPLTSTGSESRLSPSSGSSRDLLSPISRSASRSTGGVVGWGPYSTPWCRSLRIHRPLAEQQHRFRKPIQTASQQHRLADNCETVSIIARCARSRPGRPYWRANT